jgi:hypothetical protein
MVSIASINKLRVLIGSGRSYFADSSKAAGSEMRCRHLIEERLKTVVIRSINHQDIGVCMSQGLRGSEPCKTGADNHDSLHSLPHFVIQSQILVEV